MAEKKIWGPNLQGKVVSAPPRQSKSSIFFEEIGEVWTVGEVIQVVLTSVLRATTKKGRQLFW